MISSLNLYLTITPNDQTDGTFLFPEAAFPGGMSSQNFTLTNTGQASMTALNISNINCTKSINMTYML